MNFQDYGVDKITGFLPSKAPLVRLPIEFEEWEVILDKIWPLLNSSSLREKVRNLPVLNVKNLRKEEELNRAFLILSLLSHAYIWGKEGEPVLNVIPLCLSSPWLAVSEKIGLLPISCYAALVYYNWRVLDETKPITLSNITTLHTTTNTIDESWFYLITVAIESAGAKALNAMNYIINSFYLASEFDSEMVCSAFDVIAATISEMTFILQQMREKCTPEIFYAQVRIYFSGWSNVPGGVFYEGEDCSIERMFREEGIMMPDSKMKTFSGGSAAQSTLIHALDTFFGVKHFPTRGTSDNFLELMRNHMPRKNRLFLKELSKFSVKDMIYNLQANNMEILNKFNICIENLKKFRDSHIQIVTSYIVLPASKKPNSGARNFEGKGTGGTEIIPFLKQSRDETKDSLLN